jgi:glycosyltransferase involved in cell wall biosynthesis
MKQKVMLIADELRTLQAGTEGQMLVLHRGLQAAGWHSELAVLRGAESVRGAWPGPVREIGISRMASPVAWWRAWQFARRLRREGFALVHIFFNDAAMLLPPFLATAGIRVIVARRDMGFWYTSMKLRALRLARRFVHQVTANSRAVAKEVASREGYREQAIAVIYNGVAPGPAPTEHPAGDRLAIGIVANIRPVKRLGDAIQAFARIASRHTDVDLEIVGGGDYAELAALADSLGVSQRVHFVGARQDVRERLSRYAVCVLTSASEGLSNAIIEYQLAGRAVVCTDTGGNPELVEHGRTGMLYPVGDIDTLAGHLDRLLGDNRLRASMGAAGRQRAEAIFAPSVMIRRHESLYRAVISGHENPVAAISDGAGEQRWN